MKKKDIIWKSSSKNTSFTDSSIFFFFMIESYEDLMFAKSLKNNVRPSSDTNYIISLKNIRTVEKYNDKKVFTRVCYILIYIYVYIYTR